MPDLLVLSEAEVEQLLELASLAGALRAALRSISSATASVPPRIGASSRSGLLGAMPGFVPDLGLGAKLVSIFRGNHSGAVPGHQALVALFDPDDGTPLALLGGTHITGMRTAMTSAIAAAALARPGATTLAVLGSGVQAEAHLRALPHLLSFTEIRVAARNRRRAAELAGGARVVDSFEAAVHGADVVCLCTDADEPVIARDWLAPGAHVGSVGSGAELDPATVAAGTVFVESRASATLPFPAGAPELAGRDPQTVTEVGEVLLGTHPGRTSDTEITVYKSTGHAAEDLAAAAVVYRAARAAGVGTVVPL